MSGTGDASGIVFAGVSAEVVNQAASMTTAMVADSLPGDGGIGESLMSLLGVRAAAARGSPFGHEEPRASHVSLRHTQSTLLSQFDLRR